MKPCTHGLTIVVAIAIVAICCGLRAQDDDADRVPFLRFETVPVFIDTGDAPLAAYQLDIAAPADRVTIVGIEGGDHDAFAEPPYHDPAAIQGERIIIAAFSTAGAAHLPQGRVRVATVHVRVEGRAPVTWRATLDAAATTGGAAIDDARAIVEPETAP